ncbi:MAG: NRAMP family divalent metal transporter, partial [Xanthobacteraceae bacterium]
MQAPRLEQNTATAAANDTRPAAPAAAGRVLQFFRRLGPGLITGASDDDPSGIGTYSQAGAQLGFAIGWTMLLTYPLMVAIQEISARIGRTTGHGIAGNLCRHYPNWLLQVIVTLLFIANAINIGADLSAMADATKLLIGGPSFLYVVAFGAVCVGGIVFTNYDRYVMVLKWMTLSLFAYVAALFAAKVHWAEALTGLFVPRITWSSEFFTTLVAILGTTISPYMFFWQTSHYTEEQVTRGRIFLWQRLGASNAELRYARWDVGVGMFLSNVVMYFIILASAATLHAVGKTDVRSAADVAESLRPLAGDGASILLALGLIGTGVLAVPVLTGSSAYAVAEALKWHYGLGARLRRAARFYAVIAVSTLLAAAFNYLGINVIDGLFWS